MRSEDSEKNECLNKYKVVLKHYTKEFTLGKYFIKEVFHKDMSAISLNRCPRPLIRRKRGRKKFTKNYMITQAILVILFPFQ